MASTTDASRTASPGIGPSNSAHPLEGFLRRGFKERFPLSLQFLPLAPHFLAPVCEEFVDQRNAGRDQLCEFVLNPLDSLPEGLDSQGPVLHVHHEGFARLESESPANLSGDDNAAVGGKFGLRLTY